METNDIIKTSHYEVRNLSCFAEHADKIRSYLQDIEGIFQYIETVFDDKWNLNNRINILFKETGNPCYEFAPATNKHIIHFNVDNKNLQLKQYPENLWGGLLHETLHAFTNIAVHNKTREQNCLDDGFDREPFIRSFQAMVYIKLKDQNKINEKLCNDFLSKLKNELKNGALELYERYLKIFLLKPDNFSWFINYVSSNKSLFSEKDSFQRDLEEIEKSLNCSRN